MAEPVVNQRPILCCARPFDDKTHRRELRRTTTLDLPLPAQA
jgi:hypothetical protein